MPTDKEVEFENHMSAVSRAFRGHVGLDALETNEQGDDVLPTVELEGDNDSNVASDKAGDTGDAASTDANKAPAKKAAAKKAPAKKAAAKKDK